MCTYTYIDIKRFTLRPTIYQNTSNWLMPFSECLNG